MSIAVYKTFSAGEVLTAADLNASLTQITSNGTDVAFPLTKNSSLGGFSLFFDAASTRSMTDSTKGVNLASTAFNDAKTTVASATTPDIWTSTGRYIDYTGTTTATGFAAASQAGASRILRCSGAAPFTAGANVLIDGFASGSTFTASAGDMVEVFAETTTQFRLKPRLYTLASPFSPLEVQDFRLTLTSGTAVTTADVTGATTLYLSPYTGNRIALYDGTKWVVYTSAEMSITNSGVGGALPTDVFCFANAGVPTLEFSLWTNDTTRSTALTTQDGVLVKSGALTRRYIGTFRSTAGGAFSDSYATRWLWNNYNRRLRPLRNALETTDTWNYTTATWRQANANAANQVDFVVGVSEDAVWAQVMAFAKNTNAPVDTIVGVGYDATNALASGCLTMQGTVQVAGQYVNSGATYTTIPAVGRHFMAWIELSGATGTTTWAGDGGFPAVSQSGIHGWVWA